MIPFNNPTTLNGANSALNKQNVCHVQKIKDQALHGHIVDHESLRDQTNSFLAEDQ